QSKRPRAPRRPPASAHFGFLGCALGSIAEASSLATSAVIFWVTAEYCAESFGSNSRARRQCSSAWVRFPAAVSDSALAAKVFNSSAWTSAWQDGQRRRLGGI